MSRRGLNSMLFQERRYLIPREISTLRYVTIGYLLTNCDHASGVCTMSKSQLIPLALTFIVKVDVQGLGAPSETDVGIGFEMVVLLLDYKQILKSQVHEHFRKRGLQISSGSTEDDMDLVRGKGQGLIILLHGRLPSQAARQDD